MRLDEARLLARSLMDEWELEHWEFKFDRAVKRFGLCQGLKVERGYITEGVISLSEHLTSLNDEVEVRDTILHEIAHAIAPARAHHGWEWKQAAIRVGADPTRCYDSARVATPEAPWTGTCPQCGKSWPYHRRRSLYCKACIENHGVWFALVYTPRNMIEAIELEGIDLS